MISKWKLIESEIVLDNFYKVARKRYKLPDGKEKDFYIALQSKTVIILPITQDNQVILVRQYRPGPDQIITELPAGRIEEGEEVLEAANRELIEETGYSGEAKWVAESPVSPYSTKWRNTIVITNCQQVTKQKTDDSEFIEVEIMPLNKFRVYIKSGKLTHTESAYLGLDYLGLL